MVVREYFTTKYIFLFLLLCNVCFSSDHELPLITHFDKNINSYSFNGIDSPEGFIYNDNATTEYRSGQNPVFYYKDKTIINGNSIASNFDDKTYSDDFIEEFFNTIHTKTNVRFVLKRSKYELINDARGLFESDTNGQIVNSIVFRKNLFSIILPPNWNPSNKYPIVINGFYGLNVNVFEQEGSSIFRFVAEKYKLDNIGMIGILWNGGGAIGSRTTNDINYEDLNDFLNLIIPVLGIDPNDTITFGNSRGAYTALNIASHEKVNSIKVKYVWATNPFDDILTISKLVGTTVPNLMPVKDSYGYYGSWTKYYDGPTLFPVSKTASLSYQKKINKLKRNKTQIHLDIGSHDDIVPYIVKYNLYKKYKNNGLKVELETHFLSGHHPDRNTRDEKILSVALDNNKFITNKVDYYMLTEVDKEIKVNEPPISLEIPRYLNDYVFAQYIITGKPYKTYRLTFYNKSADVYSYEELKTNLFGNVIKEINPEHIPYGENELVKVEIKRNKYVQLKVYKTTKPVDDNLKMYHSDEYPTNFSKRPEQIVFELLRGTKNEYALTRNGMTVTSNNGVVAFTVR